MKYLKTFENIKHKFKIGDYVIVRKSTSIDSDELDDYLKNNVGQIENIDDRTAKLLHSRIHIEYIIKYLNIPGKFWPSWTDRRYNFSLYQDQIRLATSEEIEMQLIKNDSEKYNL